MHMMTHIFAPRIFSLKGNVAKFDRIWASGLHPRRCKSIRRGVRLWRHSCPTQTSRINDCENWRVRKGLQEAIVTFSRRGDAEEVRTENIHHETGVVDSWKMIRHAVCWWTMTTEWWWPVVATHAVWKLGWRSWVDVCVFLFWPQGLCGWRSLSAKTRSWVRLLGSAWFLDWGWMAYEWGLPSPQHPRLRGVVLFISTRQSMAQAGWEWQIAVGYQWRNTFQKGYEWRNTT